MISTVLLEFFVAMILIMGIEIVYIKWGSAVQIAVTNKFSIEAIMFLKALLIATLLGRLTLNLGEFWETHSVLRNPEKSLDIIVSQVQYALLHICILPLGYVIATYTMLANSALNFIVFVVGVYFLCAVRVTLEITTRFYQQMLLNYNKQNKYQ